jgi:hypothetical protein
MAVGGDPDDEWRDEMIRGKIMALLVLGAACFLLGGIALEVLGVISNRSYFDEFSVCVFLSFACIVGALVAFEP